MNYQTLLKRLRIAGFAEALSWVFLLFFAMPLKYFFDKPLAVKYVGWAHGVLFMVYVALLAVCFFKYKWSFIKSAAGVFFAFLPFGTLYFDKTLQKEEAAIKHA
ncbi:MAG: DUF3817 domain-containing protein [Hydrotalea sp.]|jgi:integral membrane protein|nr:DUF3817 domain-containing protein [Hydrotalea sp.]